MLRYNHRMIFPQFARLTDVALLLLRIMVGIVFMSSGWKHLKDPRDIMLGAIQKKIFVWQTGFWGKSGANGWSYDGPQDLKT